MTHKHTKGPWTVKVVSGSHGGVSDYAAVNLNIIAPSMTMDQVATITKAAPDLLAALEYLESVLSEQSEETFERELLRIRAAIARATE